MSRPHTTRVVGRTVVVGVWLAALAVAAEPVWLAVLVAVALTSVWAAPFLLSTDRRPAPRTEGVSRSSQ